MPKFLWTLKQDIGPAPRYGHAMTFDMRRKRVILFGGDPIRSGLLNDTWEWDGENWTQLSDMGPAPRCEFGLVYDSVRQKAVLFGGNAGNRAKLGDTWEWDGENWTQVEDSGPAPRLGLGMAFDTRSGQVICFGGESAAGFMGDTWGWDGDQWTQLEETGPAARRGHVMAYESTRERVLLYGGESDAGLFGDTWGWDGAAWTQVSSLGPGPRTYAAMDTTINRTAFFGGFAFSGENMQPTVFGNTWEWDGKHWTHRQDFGPSPRWGHAMAYDSDRQRLVLFGGLPVFNPNPDPLLADRLMHDTWEHAVTPSPVVNEQPGAPGEPQPIRQDFLTFVGLSRDMLILPGARGGNMEPVHVACTPQLNGISQETRNGVVIANLPERLFSQFSIPAGSLSTVVDLAIPALTPPGNYQVDAILDGITISATLTIKDRP